MLPHPFSMILDVETTGVNPHQDRVIEVALALCGGRTIYAVLSTLINPGYDFGINAVNGIAYSEVTDKPTFAELAFFLHNLFCIVDEVVAYNGAFDLRFLKEEFARCDLSLPTRTHVDPMKHFGKAKLAEACRKLSIPTDDLELHRALGDVIATYRMFCVMRLAPPVDSSTDEPTTLGVRLS